MTARKYSNSAPPTTLAAPAGTGDTTITLVSSAGLPATYPFTLVIDPDGINTEIVTVTNLAGPVATVTRGQDNTTAVTHDSGVSVQHCHTARDFSEPQVHADTDTGVHNVGAGLVVGTTLTQNLSNKTLVAGSAATIAAIIKGTSSQTANLTSWQTVASAVLATMSKDGGFTARTVSAVGADATAVPLTAQGFTAQSGHLFDLKNVGGTVLSYFDKDGILNVPSLVATTISSTSITGVTDLTITGDLTADDATLDVMDATLVTADNVRSPQTTGGVGRVQLPYARIVRSSGTQSIPDTTVTQVTFNAVDEESDAGFGDHANEQLVIPVTGVYHFEAQISANSVWAGSLTLSILKNGTAISRAKFSAVAGANAYAHVSTTIRCTASDTITAETFQNSGGAVQLDGTVAPGNSLSGFMVRP